MDFTKKTSRTSLEFILQEPHHNNDILPQVIPCQNIPMFNKPSLDQSIFGKNNLVWLPSDTIGKQSNPKLYKSRCKGFKNHFVQMSFTPVSSAGLSTSQRRARRRFHEINRPYNCTFGQCNKSYGALNHLNAHIIAKNHGTKRFSWEFKHNIKFSPKSQPHTSEHSHQREVAKGLYADTIL